MSFATASIELALQPLDRLRVAVLRATMPVSGYFAGRRGQRVALLGVVSIILSLAGTAAAPLWMLALGPIVLGVPHLLADLRYCVVQPRWHRRPAIVVGVGLPLLAVALGADTAVGFAAVAGVCAAIEAPPWRRLLGIALAGLGALTCILAGAATTLVLLHLHNLVAVVLWWRWRRRDDGGLHLLPIAAFVAGMVIIAAGALDPLITAGASASASGTFAAPAGLDLGHHLRALAPGLGPTAALRLVLLFTFAQSVHYVIWLRLVPEDDRGRPTPRSFAASWRALVDACGPTLVALAALASLALVAWALIDLAQARAGYLRLARFHLFLELAVLASLGVSGRRFVLCDHDHSTPTREPHA